MNKKGITLIALSVTILVMTILGAATVGSVIGLVKVGRKNGYEATSKIVREQVEIVYKETMSKAEENENFTQAFARLYVPMVFDSPTTLPTSTIPTATITLIAGKNGMTNTQVLQLPFYRVNTPASKKVLNIESTDLNFYVSFEKNIVFSMAPIKINNKNVYTLEEIDPNFTVSDKSVNISQINIGDTILYNPTKGVTDPSLLTYTSVVGSALAGSNVSGNGHSVQTITATASHNQYLVIGKENGRLKLMAKNVSVSYNPNIYFSSGQGFLYLEEELHKMCSVFGHGTGADKSNITTYTIGNPVDSRDIKTKKFRDSGARSLTIEDLQEMTTVDLNGDKNDSYPTVKVIVPTLNGETDKGREVDHNFYNNFIRTYSLITSGNFILKPEYSALGLSNIFTGTYLLANRAINTTSTTASFMVRTAGTSNISAFPLVTGTASDYTDSIPSGRLRPVVFLSPDVKLKSTSTVNQWQVVQ